MNSHLLTVATGNYIRFVPQLLETAERYFLPSLPACFRNYVVFTNQPEDIEHLREKFSSRLEIIPCYHSGFPHSSMNRYCFYREYLVRERTSDEERALFFIDSDARFAAPIHPDDLLPDNNLACAVQHCAFIGRYPDELPFEDRTESACHVPEELRRIYYGGGFWGAWEGMANIICAKTEAIIGIDTEADIIPKWHDESALNKVLSMQYMSYFIHTLSPAYHYPEHWQEGVLPHIKAWWDEQGLSFEPRIVFLDKYRGKSNGAELLRKN